MRELKIIIFVLGVPFANIVLNYLVQETARTEGAYLNAIFSREFGAAFIVGTASILIMLALYRTGISLGSGIVLMGAVSIVGGAAVGMIRDQQWLPIPELLLLGGIVTLFTYRWFAWASSGL